MLTVISPAKTLDFITAPSTSKFSNPQHLDRSSQLIEIMRDKSAKQLSKLMHISPNLAELNTQRFADWKPPFTPANSKQAILAFKGDVYLGLEADKYSPQDFNFAQKNLRILSGLYGLLKPLDLIQAYRLEMGIKLKNPKVNDLYTFWTEEITQCLTDELNTHRSKSLINLASIEYFKAIDPSKLPGKLITPIFKDYSNGTYKILSFYAKKARGHMATFIIKNRITSSEQLRGFDVDGYAYNELLSSDNEWVFTRQAAN
ncbi:MAG: peroxide stress protein YaaA [Pseudomonadales bacterium]|nr:peroxide stress protein YaaA [Pseudomonadales bacterium]